MFVIRPDIKSLKAAPEQIVAIIESINSPMVAAADKPSEAAKAYILGMRNASGLFSIYVYLHLTNSRECLIYLHDPAEIPMESYHDTELEAIQFCESMGFMIDNLNFRNLNPEQQSELMQGLPIFYEDLNAFAKIGADSEEETSDEADQVDLSPLEGEILELAEVAEVVDENMVIEKLVSEEGLAKIVRMLSSF